MEMNQVNIGFIGFGNMGQAMAKGWLHSEKIRPNQLAAVARNFEKLKKISATLGVKPFEKSTDLIEQSDIIILAVKPHQIKDVVEPIKDALKNKLVISVAAGITYSNYQEWLVEGTAHLSTIPNTPVSIGEGIIVAEATHSLSEMQTAFISQLFSELGVLEFVETEQLSIAGTIAGCGPAFASLFIEALGDAAVKYGLSREQSYRLASQMLAGTGKMQLHSGDHPGVMKDAVTSPGGTTIKGISALEKHGFRGTILSAIDAIEG